MTKHNKDFLKDSFYKHSESRAKRTDEMDQQSLVWLIEHMVRVERQKEIKESDECNDGDSSQ